MPLRSRSLPEVLPATGVTPTRRPWRHPLRSARRMAGRGAAVLAVAGALSLLLPAGAQTLAAPLSVGPNPVRAGQTVTVVAPITRDALGCDSVELVTTAVLPRGDEPIRSFGPGGFGLADGRFVPFPVATFDATGVLRASFTLSPTLLPGNYAIGVGRACGASPAGLFQSTSFAVLVATPAPAGPAAPSLFVPTSPFRLFDTRSGLGGLTPIKVVGNTMFDVQVTGRGTPPIPANATAVVMNLTYVDAEGGGYVTAWPAGEDFPGVSNLNKTGPGPSPNQATIKLGAGGRISVFNQGGPVHLLGDVAGYYVPFSSVSAPATTTTVPTVTGPSIVPPSSVEPAAATPPTSQPPATAPTPTVTVATAPTPTVTVATEPRPTAGGTTTSGGTAETARSGAGEEPSTSDRSGAAS